MPVFSSIFFITLLSFESEEKPLRRNCSPWCLILNSCEEGEHDSYNRWVQLKCLHMLLHYVASITTTVVAPPRHHYTGHQYGLHLAHAVHLPLYHRVALGYTFYCAPLFLTKLQLRNQVSLGMSIYGIQLDGVCFNYRSTRNMVFYDSEVRKEHSSAADKTNSAFVIEHTVYQWHITNFKACFKMFVCINPACKSRVP